MSRLQGKVALITGCSVGIGEAIARRFAREGASVVITGRRKELLDKVVGDITGEGGRAIAVAGSVADEAHARAAVDQAVRAFGKLDVLVNNAGIGAFGKLLHETDDATWDDVLAVNLTGAFRMTRAAVPAMLKAGGGSIINISSIASLVGIPMLAAYAASKGGMDALTRCTAIDYAKQGIRCNAMNPGLVATPMAASLISDQARLDQVLSNYPIARPGTPEEVAALALYLASDESAWMTGTIVPIDGGMTAR
ncbi:MAG: glucose 1-dehydrogenase [Nitrospirota bacterium]|nr:glucose 1-dehydrogenase [Nitrospirota bacterium]MDE3035708.1 glucose 1-dehydrogenase [Nitrospirota bacterium]MDE3241767.1 glucose 1-dehydrogenase [Nitrospirota bacterium]